LTEATARAAAAAAAAAATGAGGPLDAAGGRAPPPPPDSGGGGGAGGAGDGDGGGGDADAAYALLCGRAFVATEAGTSVNFSYAVRHLAVTLGRSTVSIGAENPPPSGAAGLVSDVEVGVGDSNKLSRRHARVVYDPSKRLFMLQCVGKNGLLLVKGTWRGRETGGGGGAGGWAFCLFGWVP